VLYHGGYKTFTTASLIKHYTMHPGLIFLPKITCTKVARMARYTDALF